MDPITAFGISCGVIQVVQASVQAFSVCKELYRDGSLAKDNDKVDATNRLASATTTLQSQMRSAPAPMTKLDADIIELCKNCDKTAKVLLDELEPLKVDTKGRLLKSISKSFHAMKNRTFIEETKKALDDYQDTLRTSILVRLDLSVGQQKEAFESLDKAIRDFMLRSDDEQITFAQMIKTYNAANQAHINGRFDQLKLEHVDENEGKVWMDNLFFPDIKARQENIEPAFRQTFEWIFSKDVEIKDRSGRSPKWDSYTDWLEFSEGVYWVHGKAGCGKSTFMSFISMEKRTFEILERWAKSSLLVVPMFFFWSLGSDMQKTSQGLLRSLVWQILMANTDFLPLLRQQARSQGSIYHLPSYTWTEVRLIETLKFLVQNAPSSFRFCFFIDGLDEFHGDRQKLIDIVDFLGNSPNTKVCVSSRPELAFRRRFSCCPNLKLHDLTYTDIEELVRGKLDPILKQEFPEEEDQFGTLSRVIVDQSEGVFLWAKIMLQNIIKDAEEGSSFDHLMSETRQCPEEIHDLYERMLLKLKRTHLQEALFYLRVISSSVLSVSLLQLVLADQDVWQNVMNGNYHIYGASKIDSLCEKRAKLIVARTCGLVEIEDHKDDVTSALHPNTTQIMRQERSVSFIHKSVGDFLDSAKGRGLLRGDDGVKLHPYMILARGQIGIFAICPELRTNFDNHVRYPLIMKMRSACQLLDAAVSATPRDTVEELFGIMDEILHRPAERKSFDSPQRVECQLADPDILGLWQSENHHTLGLAVYWGLWEHVRGRLSKEATTPEQRDFLLVCATIGVYHCLKLFTPIERHKKMIEELLRLGANPNVAYEIVYDHGDICFKSTAWGVFMHYWYTYRSWNDTKYSDLMREMVEIFQMLLEHEPDVHCAVCCSNMVFIKSKTLAELVVWGVVSPLYCVPLEKQSKRHKQPELREMEALLQSRGATVRWEARIIFARGSDGQLKHYLVKKELQDFANSVLLPAWIRTKKNQRFPAVDGKSIEILLSEIEESQTDADIAKVEEIRMRRRADSSYEYHKKLIQIDGWDWE